MRRIGLFLPTGRSRFVAFAALAWLLLGFAGSILLDSSQPDWHTGNCLFINGFLFFPIAGVFLSLAVWFEKRPAPKFVWGCGAFMLLIAAIGMITAAAILAPDNSHPSLPVELFIGLFLVGSPVFMALAISVAVAYPHLREDLFQRGRGQSKVDSKEPAA